MKDGINKIKEKDQINKKSKNVSKGKAQKLNKMITDTSTICDAGVAYASSINDDEMNKETTLESLFSSPIIPIVNKNFYPVLLETSNNLDKFIELDVVKKISNLVNPYLEAFAFNYKNATYLYRCDERYGNSFFKYDSAIELVNEVKNELNYDLTYFYENKLSKELVGKKKLEDKEREISLKLEDVKFNISKVKTSIEYMGASEVLNVALENLQKRQGSLEDDLQAVKELKFTSKERI